MVTKTGQIEFFWRWQSALARGENILLLNQNFGRYAEQLLRTLLALNRAFFFEETYTLIEHHLPDADVARLRRLFRYRRTFWNGPPPGLPLKWATWPGRQSAIGAMRPQPNAAYDVLDAAASGHLHWRFSP